METIKKYGLLPHSHSDHVTVLLEEAMALNNDPKVAEKLKECYRMVHGLNEYLEKTASPQSSIQNKVWEDSFKEDWEGHAETGKTSTKLFRRMVSGQVEGQFLRLLAELTGAKRILEVGMFTGYSAVTFAESPFCEEMVSLEIEPYLAEFVKTRVAGTEIERKLEIIIGPAMDSLRKLKDEGRQFDLIFIDANKDGYLDYYKFIMDNKLVSPTGGILVDNVLWKAEVWPEPTTPLGKMVYDFNEFVMKDERVMQVISPVRDGLMMIKPKFDNNNN